LQDRVIEPCETSAIARIYTVNIERGPSDASPHGWTPEIWAVASIDE
jgi:hypothetical protein